MVPEGLAIGHCNERRWTLPVRALVSLDVFPHVSDADAFVAVTVALYFRTVLSIHRLHVTAALEQVGVLAPELAIEAEVSFGLYLFQIWKWKLKAFTTKDK